MNLQGPYRDIAKHSAIYGTGQILTRLASFLLLPIYTTYLRPADYGVIAILDFIAGLLGVALTSGIITAVSRYHFESQFNERQQQQVWWTGMTFIAIVSTGLVGMGLLLSDGLASVALGESVIERELYVQLILATIWVSSFAQLPAIFFRIRKWSGLFVSFSFGRLLVNIALNVYFLAIWDLGVLGILLGNLITECLNTLCILSVVIRQLGTYALDWLLGQKLWKFAAPLILVSFLSTVMHQAGRYFLRMFTDMDQVGLYSLAYMIGQGVLSVALLPFSMIWGVIVFEIAHQPDAKQTYVDVFEYFTYGVSLILLGTALFAKPLLHVMVAPDYISAAAIVPIICLAFFFFSLHGQFNIPALLAKRTTALVPVTVLAVLVNIGANAVLIPRFGGMGAAWASVITFAVYSFGGLFWYRKIDRYDYPFKKCTVVVVGIILSYMVFLVLEWSGLQIGWLIAAGTFIWLVWTVGLFGFPVWRLLHQGDVERIKNVVFSKS